MKPGIISIGGCNRLGFIGGNPLNLNAEQKKTEQIDQLTSGHYICFIIYRTLLDY